MASAAADLALYADSSALVKLIVREPESAPLLDYVAGRDLVTSELALAEVPRAIRRLSSGRRTHEHRGLREGIGRVLNAVALIPTTREILLAAGRFPEAFLRTLDAVHIASALVAYDDIEAFVTYDANQADAARHAGFAVESPA